MTDDIAAAEPVAQGLPAPDTDASQDPAPYGYMTDPVTGEQRPRKRPGRRSKKATPPAGRTPSIEELQGLGSLAEAAEDKAPGAPPKGRLKAAPKPVELPPFRAGVIAKGVNRLYRRAGRILRLWDYDIGTAVILTTKVRPKDDDDDDVDDLTVGEAWENLAKTNPRIRAFLLRFLTGGAWSTLIEAHLPIVMAIAMKDGIRQRIPFMGLAEAFLTDEPEPGQGGEAVPSGLAQMLGGIGPDDMAQMMQMAQGMMGQVANGMPRGPSVPRDPAADQG